jgi:transketolase
LARLAKLNKNVIAIDGEVSNSTFSNFVKKETPKQFIEAYIAEQNMISMGLGLTLQGFKVYASSFGAFLTRAHDQIRMAAISKGNMVICGSHSGCSIGEDGASQMALEDISMFRALEGSTILYPSDAVSCEKLVKLSATQNGITYIRTTRGKTHSIYPIKEEFEIGDFKILKQGEKDKAVIVGSGITVHEALKAYDELLKNKIQSAVVDLYCIKPFNSKKFIRFVQKHGLKIVICEDHRPEGGIGEMIAMELAGSGIPIAHLAVRGIPHSGAPKEVMSKEKIDYKAIIKEVKKII